ncbi:hypothetical protein G9F45_23910 [Escherichia coli]|nr:hypothetical protein G9F45_23910 [Escherichia coli]
MQILKVIGLLMEYPDELLWECKEDALALICRAAPMLTDFTRNLLNTPLLDKQAEWPFGLFIQQRRVEQVPGEIRKHRRVAADQRQRILLAFP